MTRTAVGLALLLASRALATPGTVTLVFVGDVMLDDGPGQTLAAGADPLEYVAPLFADADLVVANLECPVATTGVEVPKPWAFRAHPRAVEVVKRHFGAVSLANNHAGDFGDDALVETLLLLDRAGVPRVGAGRTLVEAHVPALIGLHGVNVALVACNEFKPRAFEAGASSPGIAWCDEQQLMRDLAVARAAGADLVIPFLHWGWEGEPRPSERQRELAHRLIDAGADAVIGGHPHVTQDPELYKGRLVLYSLGNFVFDGFSTEPTRTGWALRLTLGPAGLVSWRTLVVRHDDRGTPRPDPRAVSPCGAPDTLAVTSCRAGVPVAPEP